MDDLSPQRREELAALLLRHGHAEWDEFDGQVVADALTPLIAGWLAAEREAGAAEVRARVEAMLDDWLEGAGPDSEAHRVFGTQVISIPHIDKTIRAALNGGES